MARAKKSTKSFAERLLESVLDKHEEVEESDDEEMKEKEVEECDVPEDKEEVEESDDEEMKEKEVEECDVPEDKEEVEESDDEDEDEDDEEEDEDLKEFDVNDDSDVFIDDEDEPVKEKSEDEEDEEDKKEDDSSSLDMEESVQALVTGENLTEDFKKKARVIFESAVKDRVVKHSRRLKGQYNQKLRAAKAKMAKTVVEEVDSYITNELVESIDTYLTHIAGEWLKENRLAVEHGIRTEITEEFIKDLRVLFESHNIMIPEGAENIVESQARKIGKLESELGAQFKKTVLLEKKLNEQYKAEVLRSVCEGLADTQIEKLQQLAGKIEFNPETYKEELTIIKESYFPSKGKSMDRQIPVEESKKDDVKAKPQEDYRMKEYKRLLKNF